MFPKRPRAILFDLDGTLIDSRKDIARACNHALAWAGRPTLSEAQISTYVGDGARVLMASASGLNLKSTELDPILDEFLRYCVANPIQETTWMPGAEAIFSALSSTPLAIVTNKTRAVAVAVLKALGASDRFRVLYGGGDGPSKPDPRAITTPLATLGVTPSEAWMIGDGLQDICAGKAAGCKTIGVLGGFHCEATLRSGEPDALVKSIDEVLAIYAAAPI